MNPLLLSVLCALPLASENFAVLWSLLDVVRAGVSQRMTAAGPPAYARLLAGMSLASIGAASASLFALEEIAGGTAPETGTHDLWMAVLASVAVVEGRGAPPIHLIVRAAGSSGCQAELFAKVVELMREAPPAPAGDASTDRMELRILAQLQVGGAANLFGTIRAGLITELEKNVSRAAGGALGRVLVEGGDRATVIAELRAVADSLAFVPEKAALVTHLAQAVEAGDDLPTVAMHLRACARCLWVRDAIRTSIPW